MHACTPLDFKGLVYFLSLTKMSVCKITWKITYGKFLPDLDLRSAVSLKTQLESLWCVIKSQSFVIIAPPTLFKALNLSALASTARPFHQPLGICLLLLPPEAPLGGPPKPPLGVRSHLPCFKCVQMAQLAIWVSEPHRESLGHLGVTRIPQWWASSELFGVFLLKITGSWLDYILGEKSAALLVMLEVASAMLRAVNSMRIRTASVLSLVSPVSRHGAET